MGRDRTLRLIAIAVCIVALIGVGLRYLWLRNERQHAEQTVAMLVATVARARTVLADLDQTRTAVDRDLAIVQANHERLSARAAMLHAELEKARADTTTAAVGAYLTAAQANNLRACLIGVSQALNQISVGDSRAIASLRAVDGPCRAAGAQ
jgi:hypothetical protein